MAILYYDDKKLFQLNTEKTTYVIGLSPEGYVGHVYYGPLLHGEPDLYPLRMDEPPFTPSVNKREKSSFLDRFPMEYPTGGIGDYRESCLNVRNVQGRMGCEIHFDSYEIFKGKRKMEGLPASFGTEEEVETLEITCKDPILGLVVVLSYSVFEKENVITRSVCVKNEGSETLKVEKIYSACLDMDNEDFEMISLHGSWARERHIQQGALRYGKQLVSSGKGESSHQEHPFVAMVTPGTDQERGEVYAMHFVYSGNFIGQVERCQFDTVRMVMGINQDEFCWNLKAGDEFQAPEVVMVYSAEGLGEMTRSYHAFYRRHMIRSPYNHKKLSLTRVSISSTTVTVVSCGYVALTYSRKLSNDFFPLPFTLSVSSSGHVAINASRLVFPITPGPYIAPVLAPFGARCLNPTPGIAPVL